MVGEGVSGEESLNTRTPVMRQDEGLILGRDDRKQRADVRDISEV